MQAGHGHASVSSLASRARANTAAATALMPTVAVGGFVHETNTYVDSASGMTKRDQFTELAGKELLSHHAAAARPGGSSVGGFIRAAEELGYVLAPAFWCSAGPSGTICAAAYTSLCDALLEGLRAAMPFDAVALDLHGAGVAEGAEDLEGSILGAVRELVGSKMPVVATLDLHGNVTDNMVRYADFLCGNHLNPHTDCFERGHEAFSILPALLGGALSPQTFVEHVPMLIPPTTTDCGAVEGRDGSIAAEMLAVAEGMEAREGVLDVTVYHGFFKSDTKDVGMHILVTADNDRSLAQRTACDMATWVWDRRARFLQKNFGAADAVRFALEQPPASRPTVLHEISDNPGSGCPGDATHLLRAVLEAGLPPGSACFGMICDADTAAAAHTAGEGATLAVSLGGKAAPELCGAPIVSKNAHVRRVSMGRWTLTAFTVGVEQNVGPMALLRIDGVDVLVASKASQVLETSPFELHGIDVTAYKLICIKSAVHFRAGFRGLAARIVPVDAPGFATTRTERFPRTKHAAPLWGYEHSDRVKYCRSDAVQRSHRL